MRGESESLGHELLRLLDDLSQYQAECLELQEEKRRMLTALDGTGLDALHSREDAATQRIRQCLQRRKQLLARGADAGIPAGSLLELAKRLPDVAASQSRALLEKAREQGRRLKQVSLSNWVLAHRTYLHTTNLFDLLARGGQAEATYGGAPSATTGGSVLDQEV